MTVRTRLAQTSAILLATVLTTTPFASAAVESQDELQHLFNDGKYTELLPKLNAALALKGPGAAAYDKYQLLMLKGETQLRTTGASAATTTFRAAAAATTDDKQVASARALAALMARTTGTKFKPKPTPAVKGAAATPAAPVVMLDVVVPEDRKQAFTDLFAEMLATAGPVVDRAKKSTGLPPITTAAASLADLRPVELEATGDDAQSKDLLKAVGERAVELMTKADEQMAEQVKAIDDSASSSNTQRNGGHNTTMRGNGGANVGVPGADPNNVGANGAIYGGAYGTGQMKPTLSAANESSLRDIAATAKKVDATATAMKATFGDGVDFTAVKTDAGKVVDAVNEVLKKWNKTAVQ